jgi:protein-disulfide isomerase
MTPFEGAMTKKAIGSTVGLAALILAATLARAGDKGSAAASPSPAASPAAAAAAKATAAAAPAPSAQAASPAPAAAPVSVDMSQTDEGAGKGVDMTLIAHSPENGSPYLGPAEAVVVVNIFSDFQCPVCRRAADPVKQLVVDFPDRVKVVFRDNALESHGRSKALALAAMAAGKQGKFWKYYDRIFANPRSIDDASLKVAAQDIGLDVAQWEKDIADPKNAERIKETSSWATQLGVPGTPGMFVNGQRQMGWGSYQGLKWMVQREINEAEKLVAAGTPTAEIPAIRIKATAAQNQKRPDETAIDPDLWTRLLLAN